MLCLKISSRGFFFVFLRVFFVFFPRQLSSATRLSKKTKKFKENQKYQRNQKKQSLGRNGEMLCPRVSSRGLFFLFFLVCLVFLVFFEFFCFFHSEAFIGYRPEKKTQTNWKKAKKTKKQKKTKSWEKVVPKGFLHGIVFLLFFKFFVFSLGCFHRLQAWEKKQNQLEENQKTKKTKKQSLGKNVVPKGFLHGIVFLLFFKFFVFSLGCFHRLQAWEKTKQTRRKPKKQKNKKTKSWEKCCAQGFPPGDCFFCFFGFLVFFNFFWFLIFEFVWHMSDIITKTNIFGRHKNQPHFNWHGPVGATKPHNYSMEIARAHRLPFRDKKPLLIAMTKLK